MKYTVLYFIILIIFVIIFFVNNNHHNKLLLFNEINNTTYKLFNPGLFIYEEKTFLIFRYSNSTKYNKPEIIISKLILYNVETDEYIFLENEIDNDCKVLGTEDPKVLMTDNVLNIYCTCSDKNCNIRLCLLKYDINEILECLNNKKSCKYYYKKILVYDDKIKTEKNWMPFYNEKYGVLLIYSINPYIILKQYKEDDEYVYFEKFIQEETNFDKNIRGTSNGIKYNNTYKFIVHKKTEDIDYTSSILTIQKDYPFKIQSLSKFKKIHDKKIEFCNGFAIKNNTMLISFGIDDVSSGLLYCKNYDDDNFEITEKSLNIS